MLNYQYSLLIKEEKNILYLQYLHINTVVKVSIFSIYERRKNTHNFFKKNCDKLF
jgi:hypothetical protein